ncbi:MAG: toll/interleukin-1 receptor domain-containing protein [Pontiellaceae bacterium]|nr:toll/interleukin-1 receptor domain-containing protein [Pontiellaceae bacterium]
MKTNHTAPDALFCVTLVGFSDTGKGCFKEVLQNLSDAALHAIRCVESVAGTNFHPGCVHAIIFTPASLARIENDDVKAVQSAAELGTCRIYMVESSGDNSLSDNNPLNDFIQCSPLHGYKDIAKEIQTYFRDADRINRVSTLRAIRDKFSLAAYGILNHLWPVSYIVAALMVFDTGLVLFGKMSWLGQYLPTWVMSLFVFYASFYVVHCIRTILRNWLLGIRIAGRIDIQLVLGSIFFGFSAIATEYAMAQITPNMGWSVISLLLATLLISIYITCRRVRFECTSISSLQESLAGSERREMVLDSISKTRFNHESFPIFQFRSNKLFISYMHKTKTQWSADSAEKVCEWAAAQGFEVFFDRSAIPPGSLWRQSLLRAVSECNIFVALLDGDVSATPWVLTESAYASLLRKSIGKPKTLLIINNPDQISTNRQNPFRRIYADVFECPPGQCFGASVLPVDETRALTEARFMQGLDSVRPMSLLAGRNMRLQPHASAGDAVAVDDFQLADRAWKSAVLLVSLTQVRGGNPSSVSLLESKCRGWLRSNNAEQRAIALNTLRFLAKGGLVAELGEAKKDAHYAFQTETSLAVRLAALDFLGAIGSSDNPLSMVSEFEQQQITDFRSRLISEMQLTQKDYAERGVQVEVKQLTVDEKVETVLRRQMEKVENLHERVLR